MISFLSAQFLITIHENVMIRGVNKKFDKGYNSEKSEKKKIDSPLSTDYYWLCAIYLMGFSTIHSFYPNMSNFLQQRFTFSNEEAGHISSLPYIIASISTAVLGTVLSKLG